MSTWEMVSLLVIKNVFSLYYTGSPDSITERTLGQPKIHGHGGFCHPSLSRPPLPQVLRERALDQPQIQGHGGFCHPSLPILAKYSGTIRPLLLGSAAFKNISYMELFMILCLGLRPHLVGICWPEHGAPAPSQKLSIRNVLLSWTRLVYHSKEV
jgi:hypothetical protein